MSILDSLNPQQLAAATSPNRVTKINALAGTGKTRCLLGRIEHLMEDQRDKTLFVAFNDSVVKEVQGKVQIEINEFDRKLVEVKTCHALALKLIGSHYRDLKYTERPQVIDLWDLVDAYIEHCKAHNLGYDDGGTLKFCLLVEAQAQALNKPIDDQLIYDNLPTHLKTPRNRKRFTSQKVLGVLNRLQQFRLNRNLVLFQDMVPLAASLDESAYRLLNVAHVLVDEVQDINHNQHLFIQKVQKHADTLTVVGDQFQSIYLFTGAQPEVFRNIGQLYPGVVEYPLEVNYRCSQPILDLANRLLEHELGSALRLTASEPRPGMGVQVYKQAQEGITDWVRRVLNEYEPDYTEITILFRTRRHLPTLEMALSSAQIPYVTDGNSYFEDPVVLDILSYFNFSAAEPWSVAYTAAWERIIRHQKYLGAKTRDESATFARNRNQDILDAWNPGGRPLPAPMACRTQGMKTLWYNLLPELVLAGNLYQNHDYTGLAELAIEMCQDVWLERYGSDVKALQDAQDKAVGFVDWLGKLPLGSDPLVTLKTHQQNRSRVAAKTSDGLRLITVHKCVHPDTLTETPTGLQPIRDIPEQGQIATPTGAQDYQNKIQLPIGPALVLTTRSGYSLTVTPEHGMTTWNGDDHIRCNADQLQIGDWLRVRLGPTLDPVQLPALPPAPQSDIRAIRHSLPRVLTPDLAEFLGLMVADGTIYPRGFRLAKRYQSVTARFDQLVQALFQITPTDVSHRVTGNAFGSKVNSTYLASWLLSFGGLSPRAKDIPATVLHSPLDIQAAFLRGLFEDGTVNERAGRVDHLHWENRSSSVVAKVQTMLLRFGIVSTRRTHRQITSLYVYGQNARRFRDRIGFVATEKNSRLAQATFGAERMYSVPLSRHEVDLLGPALSRFERQNARWLGYLSRKTLEHVLQCNPQQTWLAERLSWHYEEIREIRETRCETMCVTVPTGNRFLQNGFDGWNSKGLEWKHVGIWNVGPNFPLPFEDPQEGRRLLYVAVTRCIKNLAVFVEELSGFQPGSPEYDNHPLLRHVEDVGNALLEAFS